MKTPFIIVALIALPVGVGLFAGDPADWNSEKAAAYLDARCKTWFEYGSAVRGSGATQSSCVCCHTVVPYALARPALRKLTKSAEPTAGENQLIAQTKLRVSNWQNLDRPEFALLYDANDDKKKESWGTEAVLNALILAFDDKYHGRPAPEPETKTAFTNLWQLQAPAGPDKGSWDWFNFGLEPWETKHARYFGACLAAIAVGSAPGYYSPAIDSAIEGKVALLRSYLKAHLQAQNLHNGLWALWASQALDGILNADERRELAERIRAKQQDDGGWNLASLGDYKRKDSTPAETASDGYATGLVVHVLRIAGAKIEEPPIARGLHWLRTHQEATGEWRAASPNKKRNPDTHVGKFITDAATAFAVLALAE
jgi:squalene-hopene/tetraprenyl-beta-curcumene cyclase